MTHRTFTSKLAFSLVELSIVLVILGLLVGGVLSGQSLIRASELRSVATQYQGYVTAVSSFRDKYFAIPGDIPNAESLWGVADPSDCYNTVSTDSKTCNGDGDGQVAPGGHSNEPFRFWQHLANAGLIEGSYSGVSDTGILGAAKENSPAGKINASLWFASYFGSVSSRNYYFDGEYNNVFLLGGFVSGNEPGAAIFRPEELWNIDTKLDDGKPATGTIVVYASDHVFDLCTDASASSTLTAGYLLSSTNFACAITFRKQF